MEPLTTFFFISNFIITAILGRALWRQTTGVQEINEYYGILLNDAKSYLCRAEAAEAALATIEQTLADCEAELAAHVEARKAQENTPQSVRDFFAKIVAEVL